MYDWIIEADAYRLRKAAVEATTPRERRELEGLAERKLAVLQRRKGASEGDSRA